MTDHDVQVGPDETVRCAERSTHHHHIDSTGVHWVHPGQEGECEAPECQGIPPDSRIQSTRTEVWDRVVAIEARQREYGMHDPGCPARLVERMNRNGGGPYYTPQPCTCWLSEEPTT